MAHKLHVGILGAGEAGSGHARAFSRLPGVEVAALWSRAPQRARRLAAQHGLADARIFEDWRRLSDQPDKGLADRR